MDIFKSFLDLAIKGCVYLAFLFASFNNQFQPGTWAKWFEIGFKVGCLMWFLIAIGEALMSNAKVRVKP